MISPEIVGAELNKMGKSISELEVTGLKLKYPKFKHYCDVEVDENNSTVYYTTGTYEVACEDLIMIENTQDEYELGVEL